MRSEAGSLTSEEKETFHASAPAAISGRFRDIFVTASKWVQSCFLAGAWPAIYASEAAHNAALAATDIDQAVGAWQGGGNMEGKEVRFGVGQSLLFAAVGTASSDGTVDVMHDSFMPLSSLFLLTKMMLDKVIGRRPGSGLFGNPAVRDHCRFRCRADDRNHRHCGRACVPSGARTWSCC